MRFDVGGHGETKSSVTFDRGAPARDDIHHGAAVGFRAVGPWHVGLPAKRGVGGGIVAVVPGKGAIAVFAPPLDEAGNSVKAQKVIQLVANRLDFNLFSPRSVGLKS